MNTKKVFFTLGLILVSITILPSARAGEQALHVEARLTSLHAFYPCVALDRMGLLAISCGLEMF